MWKIALITSHLELVESWYIVGSMIYEEETLSVVGRGPQGRRETYQRFTKYY